MLEASLDVSYNTVNPASLTPLVLVGAIGLLSAYIDSFHWFDLMRDQVKAVRDNEDSFDFIVGEQIIPNTLLVLKQT